MRNDEQQSYAAGILAASQLQDRSQVWVTVSGFLRPTNRWIGYSKLALGVNECVNV